MGIVYLAHDPVIGRQVAVKVLRTLDDAAVLERFKREIRIAGALNHPSIVRIYDAGEIDDQPFVAMEYVAGRTLDALIKKAVPLDLDQKLGLLIDLADGLAYAHGRAVVHRDIKPANLIVDEHQRLKILDFGVARFAGAGNTSNLAVGTPGYMSPEQLRGQSADARSDIFAAGVVAYELIAYRKPFAAEEVAAVHHRILHEEPKPLEEIAPGIPTRLGRLLFRCLDKDRDRRLGDAAGFASDLREVRESLTDEETTVTAQPPPDHEKGDAGSDVSTPRRASTSTAERVAELRRRTLQEAGDRARDAWIRADYAGTVYAAEQALVVDPDHPEMLSLLEQAKAALDRTVAQRLLERAREHVASGELDDARRALQDARTYGITTAEFRTLERTVHRELEERVERIEQAARAQEHLARAGGALARGALTDAERELDAALTLAPGLSDALQLKAWLTAAQARRAEEERKRAQALASQRSTQPSDRDPETLPTLRPAPSEPAANADVRTVTTVVNQQGRPEPAVEARAAAAGAPVAVWGRSLRLNDGPRLRAGGWVLSAVVHLALGVGVMVLLLSGYSIARPPEPSVFIVLSAVPVPSQQPELRPSPSKPVPAVSPRQHLAPQQAAPPLPETNVSVNPPDSPPQSPPAVPVEAPNAIRPELSLGVPNVSLPGPPEPSTGTVGSISEEPVADFDRAAVIVKRVRPLVPAGATGIVRVQVTVASTGKVTRVTLLDETPYASLIVEAAEQLLFRPATRRGRSVAVNVTVHFDLATDR
jgi:TonB family protein